MKVTQFLSVSAFCAIAACGQAVVEHSTVTAGASAASAGAGGVGKSIGGVFRSLNETADKATPAKSNANLPASAAANPRSTPARPPSKPSPVSAPIDPSKITEGLDRDKLTEMFGEPLLRFSEIRKSGSVERLWYNTTSGQIAIVLIDDKVAPLRTPASEKQEPEPHH